MKTKIFLTLCAFLTVLCTAGCAAKTELTGTAWKSSSAPLIQDVKGKRTTSTATVFFMKNNAFGLEISPIDCPDSNMGPYIPSAATGTGSWTANANSISFSVTVSDGQNETSFNDKNYTVQIENEKMTWLNSDGTTYATWEKRK